MRHLHKSTNYLTWLPALLHNASGTLTAVLMLDVLRYNVEGEIFYVTSEWGVCFKGLFLYSKRNRIYSCTLLRAGGLLRKYIFTGFWWVCVCVGVCPWMIRHCMLPTSSYSDCFLTLPCPVLPLLPTVLPDSQTPASVCVSIMCHWVTNDCTYMGNWHS